MAKTLADLSQAGKEQLAFALLLWKDFKSHATETQEESKMACSIRAALDAARKGAEVWSDKS